MITQKFSRDETRKLKKLLSPYGAIKECCEKTGIHRSTISRILKTGEATSIVVVKMRSYLDGFTSRMFVEQAGRRNAA